MNEREGERKRKKEKGTVTMWCLFFPFVPLCPFACLYLFLTLSHSLFLSFSLSHARTACPTPVIPTYLKRRQINVLEAEHTTHTKSERGTASGRSGVRARAHEHDTDTTQRDARTARKKIDRRRGERRDSGVVRTIGTFQRRSFGQLERRVL